MKVHHSTSEKTRHKSAHSEVDANEMKIQRRELILDFNSKKRKFNEISFCQLISAVYKTESLLISRRRNSETSTTQVKISWQPREACLPPPSTFPTFNCYWVKSKDEPKVWIADLNWSSTFNNFRLNNLSNKRPKLQWRKAAFNILFCVVAIKIIFPPFYVNVLFSYY